MEIVREKEWETCAHSAPAGYIAGCRRAASFPFFGDHSLISTSALKVRSQSESEALNKYRLCQINLDTFRKRPRAIFEERDEGSECESDSGSSSYDDCDSFCQAAITEVSEVSIKPRKSVRFADDCGKELYCVRVMSEPSDYPPRISPSVIRKLRGESYTEENISTEASATWNILFKQPASEYIRFRERLERDKVSLENVVIKSDGSKIVGTIKVANISFEKKVFVRFTTNNWQSYMDREAAFQPCTSKIYDTFTFEINLPMPYDKGAEVIFCICYIANGAENWDSNGGDNYRVCCSEKNQEHKKRSSHIFGSNNYLDRDDAYKLEHTEWTNFASWKNLSTSGPYW